MFSPHFEPRTNDLINHFYNYTILNLLSQQITCLFLADIPYIPYIICHGVKMVDILYEKIFSDRVAKLRIQKGVSARDMSLSLGQNVNYINNIESGKSFPSMTSFFYICEYLNISPMEFFDFASENPWQMRELGEKIKLLSPKQLDAVLTLVDGLTSRR